MADVNLLTRVIFDVIKNRTIPLTEELMLKIINASVEALELASAEKYTQDEVTSALILTSEKFLEELKQGLEETNA